MQEIMVESTHAPDVPRMAVPILTPFANSVWLLMRCRIASHTGGTPIRMAVG